MEIIWKDIPGYEGLYRISNNGIIESLGRFQQNHTKLQWRDGKIKSVRQEVSGYLVTDLYKDNKQQTIRVHRLVALTFIPNPENKETVNHKDGNKQNNNVDNLEWATSHEQSLHIYQNNLKTKENIEKAIGAMNKKLSKQVKCLETEVIYKSASEAGRQNNVSPSLIMRCCRGEAKTVKGKHWTYV